MSTPDIFLSYSREDAARAKLFAKAFAAEGFAVWWDAHLRSGEEYDRVTEAALRDAKAVAVLWSKRSVDSSWVRAEATQAYRARKLMPAMIEDCIRPVMFELTQTAELSHWKGDRADPAWQAYVSDIGKLVGRDATGDVGDVPPAGEQAAKPRRTPGHMAAVLAGLLIVAFIGGWAAWHGGWLGGGKGAGGKEVRLVVTPLTAIGSDPNEGALAQGITEELITRLRRVPGLQVVSGNGPAEAGSAASDRLEGSVRMDGKDLRVSARLEDGGGNVLWSDNFDRKLSDLFTVQENIAIAVANALSVSLDVGIDSRAYGGTNNTDAFANFVLGQGHLFDPDRSQSIGYLQQAVALDPQYAQAYAMLSGSYGVSLFDASTKAQAEDFLAKDDQASARALALNPNLWITQIARAWFETAKGDFTSAAGRIARAEQAPNKDPDYEAGLGTIQQQLGRLSESLAHYRAAETSDPTFAREASLIDPLFYSGRYDEALKTYAELAAKDPTLTSTPGFAFTVGQQLFWAHMLSGDAQGAKALAVSAKLGPPYDEGADFRFDPVNLPDLPPDQLKQWADRKFGYGGRVALGQRALFASYFGNQPLALEYLELSFQRPGAGGNQYLWHPALAKLRQTPGFADLVTRLGLVDAWRKSGDWADQCKPLSSTEISCS